MGYIEGSARGQMTLLPASIEDYITEENPVRVIDAFVCSLDMAAAGFSRDVPAPCGRPAYDPRNLLKLYLYGYMNRIRSSRKLMLECRRNLELFWLLHCLRPDFRTISDFRKHNRQAIQNVFRAFVKACLDLDLLQGDTAVIDSTKIRAVNNIKRSYTQEVLQKKLAYLAQQEAQLQKYLGALDSADLQEALELSLPPDKARHKLAAVRTRAQKYRDYSQRLQATGEKQILDTDPQAYTMHTKNGLYPSYNIQTATDPKHHIITSFAATNLNNDQGLLHFVANQARQALQAESFHVIADKGYESREDIERCVLDGIIPDVGFKYDKRERIHVLDHIPAHITPELRASPKPEDIRTCLHAGVLPDCYQGSSLRVELQHLGTMSCFLRHADGRVTCPMGRELFKRVQRANGSTDYSSREACRTCPNRCTQSRGMKTVRFGPHTSYVPVLMYGNSQYSLQPLPNPLPHPPANNFNRLPKAKARVMLYIRRNDAMQQLRKQVVEHPFGTIKWYDGAHYFLCKGKEAVSAETALMFSGYNLRRAIRLLGVKALLRYFHALISKRNKKMD